MKTRLYWVIKKDIQNIIKGLLKKNPNERITLNEVLRLNDLKRNEK